jgi:hypothetical protein
MTRNLRAFQKCLRYGQLNNRFLNDLDRMIIVSTYLSMPITDPRLIPISRAIRDLFHPFL